MRALALLVASCACVRLPDADPSDARPPRETAWWEEDTATEDTSATPDTLAIDTALPLDTSTPSDADSDAPDTFTPPIDTAPPPVTWGMDFPIKAAPGDVSPAWFVDRASLLAGEEVFGTRRPPMSPLWRSWSATLNFEADALTCSSAAVVFTLRWNDVDEVMHSASATVSVLKAPGIQTFTVSGVFSTPPVPKLGQPLPAVRLSVRTPCGRLLVWPSTATFADR